MHEFQYVPSFVVDAERDLQASAAKGDSMGELVIRRLDNCKEVYRVDTRGRSKRVVNEIVRRLLVNLGEDYYVDESEVGVSDRCDSQNY